MVGGPSTSLDGCNAIRQYGNMKRFTVLFFLICFSVAAGPVEKDCTFRGKKLYGRVQFVDSFPDIKVKIVDSFPDLKVKKVKAFADRCGEWQIVRSFPDLKVQIVDSFPDITIQYVDAFPGL